MNTATLGERRAVWPAIKPYFTVFDWPLLLIVGMIFVAGTVTMYSAGIDFPGRLESNFRNIVLALLVMWAAAIVPPQLMMRSTLR